MYYPMLRSLFTLSICILSSLAHSKESIQTSNIFSAEIKNIPIQYDANTQQNLKIASPEFFAMHKIPYNPDIAQCTPLLNTTPGHTNNTITINCPRSLIAWNTPLLLELNSPNSSQKILVNLKDGLVLQQESSNQNNQKSISGEVKDAQSLEELQNLVHAREEKLQNLQQRLQDLQTRVNAVQTTQVESAQDNSFMTSIESLIRDILGENAVIFASAASILGLLGLFIWQKKRKKAQDQLSTDDPTFLNKNFDQMDKVAKNIRPKQEVHKETAVNQSTNMMSEFTRGTSGVIETSEVDPIAESDVYMAYGRDMQAEEILLSALEREPSRHDIRSKLLEIYLQRRDVKSFSKVFYELKALCEGKGSIWLYAQELAEKINLDPSSHTQTALSDDALKTLDDELMIQNHSQEQEEALKELDTPKEETQDHDQDILEFEWDIKNQEPSQETQEFKLEQPSIDFDIPSPLTAEHDDISLPIITMDKEESDVNEEPFSEKNEVVFGNISEEVTDEDLILEIPADQDHEITLNDPSIEPSNHQNKDSLDFKDPLADESTTYTVEEKNPQLKDSSQEYKADEKNSSMPSKNENFLDFNFDIETPEDKTPLKSEEGETSLAQPSTEENDILSQAMMHQDPRLNLVAVYLEMGDAEGAKQVLEEIIEQTSDEETVQHARKILEQIHQEERA
jgi:FimV-like protein